MTRKGESFAVYIDRRESDAHYQCAVCRDIGKVTKKVDVFHRDFGKTFICPNPECEKGQENRRRFYARVLSNSGLNKEYWNYQIEDYNVPGKRLAALCCSHFAHSPGVEFDPGELARARGFDMQNMGKKDWFVIYGKPGLGKTGLAAGVINHLAACGRQGVIYRLPLLIQQIQDTYGTGKMSAGEIIDAVKNAPVLILDDWAEYASADRIQKLDEILRWRRGENLPVMVTTNLTYEKFEEAWGYRIASILGTAHWIPIGGEIWRKRVNQEVQAW